MFPAHLFAGPVNMAHIDLCQGNHITVRLMKCMGVPGIPLGHVCPSMGKLQPFIAPME